MIVYLNDKYVPEEQAFVSAFDRGFLYGDGLFETVRVCDGKLIRWQEHMRRFEKGLEYLKISPPKSQGDLTKVALELLRFNQLADCLLRVAVSRGKGPRGYSPAGADSPTLLLSPHSLPEDWNRLRKYRLVTSTFPADPLGSFKTSSKLIQVLARAEAEAKGADEALVLDSAGNVMEATASNVFWIKGEVVCTTPLSSSVLPGITRAAILDICRANSISTLEQKASPKTLLGANGVFLTQTTFGIIEAISLNGQQINQSALTARLHTFYMIQLTT